MHVPADPFMEMTLAPSVLCFPIFGQFLWKWSYPGRSSSLYRLLWDSVFNIHLPNVQHLLSYFGYRRQPEGFLTFTTSGDDVTTLGDSRSLAVEQHSSGFGLAVHKYARIVIFKHVVDVHHHGPCTYKCTVTGEPVRVRVPCCMDPFIG